jgi:molecular chaperone DnaK
LSSDVSEAVITVPAYFSEAQRRATRSAGKLAGFTVRRLLNEPTAAAIAWAWAYTNNHKKGDGEAHTILVYDLGGGTFDATVLAMRGNDGRVISTAGDNLLGGTDFDELLLNEALVFFEGELGKDSIAGDPVLVQQLSDLVERAKIELSSRDSTTIVLPFAGLKGKAHPTWNISREYFEGLISPHIEKTMVLSQRALADGGLSIEAVDRLVLSGGSSRIPLVRRRLAEIFGREGEGRVNPEEIVAYGASVFAALSTGAGGDFKVRDAVSRSFGLEIDGDVFIPLIPKNTAIPARKSRIFTTVADDQRTVEIHVLQGESKQVSENLSLGRFILSGIRSCKRGEPRINVEFSIDDDEILQVRARDLDSQLEQRVTIAMESEGLDRRHLRSLIDRLASLADVAQGDRTLEGELEETLGAAEKLLLNLEDDTDGSPDHRNGAAEMELTLRALIAEMEARTRSL